MNNKTAYGTTAQGQDQHNIEKGQLPADRFNFLPDLHGADKQYYNHLRNSGMFFVWYPHATGNYEEDCK